MKFNVEELEVLFPYPFVYPEQYKYMLYLKRALDASGTCLLEMPSGTGKTVSLLSLCTAFQAAHPREAQKIVYCSRTVSEIEQVMEEARRVTGYRSSVLGEATPSTLSIAQSSRRNLCVHPQVSEEKDGRKCDAMCRDITASWVREKAKSNAAVEICPYYRGFEERGTQTVLYGTYSLEDLRKYGREHTICPYFLARHLVTIATTVVFSYQYIIDPRISELITKTFAPNSIIIFDEAHNIDNVCIEALSIDITLQQTLEAASRNIKKIEAAITVTKTADAEKLKREYLRLVNGLARPQDLPMSDDTRADPVLPPDVINEAVPGNIRRAEHFMSVLRRLVEYLKMRLRGQTVSQEIPVRFLLDLYDKAVLEPKTLKFCTSRLNSLLRSLELSGMNEYSAISLVCEFATLVSTYSKGFTLLFEPFASYGGSSSSVLHFSCLDASIALAPILEKYRSIVITSGTLSPIDMYPRILNIRPVLSERLPMSLARSCICPLIVGRGSDQVAITTRMENRMDQSVMRNFGSLLQEMSAAVPDGIICFFTSYAYMEQIVTAWYEMRILNNILANKLIFVETPDGTETSLALLNYKRACDSGRGAILLAVARGKLSEGIDFSNHYGRCVILFGIPFVYTQSYTLKARLEFLSDCYRIKEQDFLTFDAMRTASQCVGRAIRGKTDYALMVFADKRYGRADKRGKLPMWIQSSLSGEFIDVSTDTAVTSSRRFLRAMGQPFPKEVQLGVSLWSLEDLKAFQAKEAQDRAKPKTQVQQQVQQPTQQPPLQQQAQAQTATAPAPPVIVIPSRKRV